MGLDELLASAFKLFLLADHRKSSYGHEADTFDVLTGDALPHIVLSTERPS